MAKSALGPIPDDHFEFDMDFDFDAAAKKYSTKQLLKMSLAPTRERMRAGDFNEADHPREPDGKFTEAGGGDAEGGDDKAIESTPVEAADKSVGESEKLNPEVTEVGGDEWNQETAVRLEKEYVEAKPKVEAILDKAVEGKAVVESVPEEDEEQIGPPEEWDSMTESDQEAALDAYKNQTHSDYLDSEIENWRSETAPDDARYQVAANFIDGSDREWVFERLAELRETLGVTWDDKAVVKALSVDHENGHYPIAKGTEIKFNTPVEGLSEEHQKSIVLSLEDAFGQRAESIESDLEPPEYLSDNIAEYQEDSWENMSDQSKFDWVTGHTDIISNYETDIPPSAEITGLPEKFDPLELGSSQSDYTQTQLIARDVSQKRATELIIERGAVDKSISAADVHRAVINADRNIWSEWKGSSTSEAGQILQLATAEELGGRLYTKHKDFMSPEKLKGKAENEFFRIGGYEGVKALVRAKWETTQLLLEKSGHNTVALYRAVVIPEINRPASFDVQIFNKQGNEVAKFEVQAGPNSAKDLMSAKDQAEAAGHTFKATEIPDTTVEKVEVPLPGTGGTKYEVTATNKAGNSEVNLPFATKEEAENMLKEMTKTTDGTSWTIKEINSDPDKLRYERLPDVDIKRNGASSTTLTPSVANGWNGSGRTVLRIEVPRTAVLSVPAYGANVHGEKEVVVTGTAWKQWDAWKGRAPDFETVPMKKAA